jgi:hypothetical protein
MTRMRIQLTEDQLKALRQLSSSTGRSIADLVRQGVELFLGSNRRVNRKEQIQRAIHAAGKFSSGTTDGSPKHNHYLAEAFSLRGKPGR